MESYRTFLMALQETFQDLIAQAENMEYHHRTDGSLEYQHYLRLLTWQDAIQQRIGWYDTSKARVF